ncbi:hypothetical protein BV20DRAFT_941233 [Pilatotrama ljubarskyi]|nr:hypothetical protein BV20DRAFT_941233 [Pilatotrama ljubarskyi]
MFLSFYLCGGRTTGWIASSLMVASAFEKGPAFARSLRAWTREFLADRHALPTDVEHTWSQSILEQKPGLKEAISAHLQTLRNFVRALDIVHFTSEPATLLRFGLAKPVSLATAQCWMHALEHRWTKGPNGQFVDGHERKDVVGYRQQSFLPAMAEYDQYARQWDKDGQEVPATPQTGDSAASHPSRKHVVYWWHNESTFYAHDQHTQRWVHKREKATPRRKGEGASLMAADFVSAEYGWLRSPDGRDSTRILFHVGKNRDGYFTHEEIFQHATKAMDILRQHFPDEEHVFIFDNAPTHLKRAADALSARHMSMGPTREGNPTFGVETNIRDENGRPIFGCDGKPMKEKVPMMDACFADGSPQSLYFLPGHPRAGVFKGMALILQERGYSTQGLRAQCPEFKCKPPALNCCCRRLLFNEPDFRDVQSLLEIHCKARRFPVLFLPKFHCELNCIEQCWGYSKRLYRQMPASSSEADLEKNVIAALDLVPLVVIRWFYTRAHRFMDAYHRGLNGKQAAWAAKKYSSHRVLPNTILAELDREGVTPD